MLAKPGSTKTNEETPAQIWSSNLIYTANRGIRADPKAWARREELQALALSRASKKKVLCYCAIT